VVKYTWRTSRLIVLPALAVVLGLAIGRPPAGSSTRIPGTAQTPIQHVVIILKENRSFDEYFGAFPGADGATQGTMSNGDVVDLTPTPDPLPNDIAHGTDAFNLAYDNGKNDAFDLEAGAFSQQGANLAYTQMTPSQIPNYWAYAGRYAIGDQMFSDFKGASFGNNMYGVAAQAGRYDATTGYRSVYGNPPVHTPSQPVWGCDLPPDSDVEMADPGGILSLAFPCFHFAALPSILSQHGVSWTYYADSGTGSFAHNSLDAISSVRYDPSLWSNVKPFSQFTSDAVAGTLPSVSWVLGKNLEHAPSTACAGEDETVTLVNAVMSGPEWSSTAIVVYWDEWGGFYDHVPPPQVDNLSFGFRVPLIVISPWTKRGAGTDGGSISSTFYSQSSILKLVEDNWALPSLDPRDAGSNDMMDFFDFSQVPKDPLILAQRTCQRMTKAEQRLLASEDPD